MLALHGVVQHNAESIRALIVLLVFCVVIFWRAALQIVIIFAGALIIIGAVTFFQGVVHAFG